MTLEQIRRARRKLALRRGISRAVWTPLILASLGIAVYGAAGVLSYALPWLEANRTQSHHLAEIDPPARVAVLIRYDEKQPANISIRHAGTGTVVRQAELVPDPEDHAIRILFELDCGMPAGDYSVVLSPGGNRKIGVASEILPSYKYIGLGIEKWTGRSGHRWIGLSPDYAYAAGSGTVQIRISDAGGKVLYAGQAASGDILDLDLDALGLGNDENQILAELSAGYEDPDAEPGSAAAASYRTARGKYWIGDGPEWPVSACPAGHAEDGALTESYLGSITKEDRKERSN